MAAFTLHVDDDAVDAADAYLETAAAKRRGHVTREDALVYFIGRGTAKRAEQARYNVKVKVARAGGSASGVTFERRAPVFAGEDFAKPDQKINEPRLVAHAAACPGHK